jgi:integrase
MQKTNEAGIYERDDGRYVIRTTVKDPRTGKMLEKQKTLEEGDSLAVAVATRDELKTLMLVKAADEQARRSQISTVGDYAERWLKRKKRKTRKSTQTKYIRVLSQKILPQLGHYQLHRLSRRDIADWIDWAEEQRRSDGKRYARATVKSWWRILKPMLKDANAEGYLSRDVTLRLSPPDTGVGNRQEKATLTGEQLGQLVRVTQQFQPTRYAEVATLAYTGMRVGELYGLEWRDIDFGAERIDVRRSAWRGDVNPTKTNSSRVVPLHDVVAEALLEHRQKMMREQHPGLEEGIVFPSTDGGRRHGTSINKPLKLIAEHIGLEVRVTAQVLRRTYNTLMVTAGVDRVVLRSIMGHTSEQMTERYSGIGLDVKREAAKLVFGGGENA